MAALKVFPLISIILALQQCWLASSEFLSPFFDNVCKQAECGKGTCFPSQNSTFGYTCECAPNWKQARPEHDAGFKFLPCVIPNCTLNYSCREGSNPEDNKPANMSFFEPCYWAHCGGGICNKTSPVTYACHCNEGYYNLLNITTLPCYSECALGMDCAALGLTIMNKSTATPSSNFSEDNSNQASSFSTANLDTLVSVLLVLAMLSWI